MSCPNLKEQWTEYAAGDLSGDERTALDAHAAGCEPCRRERDACLRLEGLLRGRLSMPRPGRSLSDQVVSRLRADRRPRLVRWAAAMAAASLLLSLTALRLAERAPTASPPSPVTLHVAPSTPLPPPSCFEQVLSPPGGRRSALGFRMTEWVRRPPAPADASRVCVAAEPAPSSRSVSAAILDSGSKSSDPDRASTLLVIALD
ncbi:MAG: zf-HC2 domain-containing protein [Planctomycetes bacterium]|nr:zf-HC2 domain-containing protein [Planctomycetota bacterium]